MIRKKRKTKKNQALGIPEPTTQSAGIWFNVKDEDPPFFKTIHVKLKSGKMLTDCARIPDGESDFYIHGNGDNITDIVEWMIPESILANNKK